MNRLTRLSGIALCLLLVAPPAFAQTVIEKITGEQLGEILKAEGFAFELDEDGDVVWHLEGFNALILVSEDRESLMFRAAFRDTEATMRKVNEWNLSKRYSRSYLDRDGDPVLELDLDLAGGVTRARIVDFLVTCRESFAAWLNEVVR